jgi:hypothetical protein
MRSVALGSVFTFILFAGLFVSQVEANTPIVTIPTGTVYFPKQDTRSVPVPGTLLVLGGGFAGLIAWRVRQRKPAGLTHDRGFQTLQRVHNSGSKRA